MDIDEIDSWNIYWNATGFSNGTNSTESEHEIKGTFVYSAGFLCTVLLTAVVLRENLKKSHFPYVILLFAFGTILGVLDHYFIAFRKFTEFSRSNIVIELMLPLIIYNYSFRMNPHLFVVAVVQCIILALPGFVVCASLNAVFAKIVLSLYKWDWAVCILFGTILTATDPSALIEFLKKSDLSAGLIAIIEGEAMLGSGIALVILKTVLESLDASHLIYERLALHVIQHCLGSLAFGYVFSVVIQGILKRSDTDIEVTFTFCSTYISYFISEMYLDVSGILTVFTFSVCISNYKSSMNYEGEDTTVHKFWQTMSFWAKALIFTIVGVHVSKTVFDNFEAGDFGFIIASYFMVSVFRGCTIALLTPLLKQLGYGFTWENAAMLTWGGLRGAIGLALLLLARKNEHATIYDAPILDKLLIQVSGVIILTLIFNASTMHWLLKSLDIGSTDKSMESMAHTVELLKEGIQITKTVTRLDKYLAGADWAWVQQVTQITDPYEGKGNTYSTKMKRAFEIFRHRCQECNTEVRIEPTATERSQMEEESKLLALRALKTSVSYQYENFGILRRSLGHLNTCIENASLKPDKQMQAEDVKKKYLKIGKFATFLTKYIMRLHQKLHIKNRHYRYQEYHLLKEKNLSPFRESCIKMHLSQSFNTLMFWVTIINIIPVVGEFTVVSTKYRIFYKEVHLGDEFVFFEVFNGILALFYIWEATVGVVALGWRMYFKDKGNIIDFIVTVTATVQIVYGIVLISVYRYKNSMASLYVLISLSAVRLFRLITIVCGRIFKFILNMVCTPFYNAFDLANGFIVAHEEIAKSALKMIESEEYARNVQFAAEDNVYEMLCYADEIEKDYPEITCAWRTHRATLYILRNMKEFIEEIVSIFMVDETDAEQLLEEIESKIAKTLSLPRHMKAKKGVRHCLNNVLWIKSETMVEKILENHSIQSFSRDGVIHDIGEKHKDIKVLYKGIIKISGASTGEKTNILPNTDSMHYFNSDGNFLDSTNSWINLGVLGYLLQTPSVTRVIASNSSMVISIPFDVISEVEKDWGNLSFHMWRPIALEIAFIVLKDEKTYENWSIEKLKIHIEEGILPNLKGKEEFDVHPIIADMVLIQGKVLDKNTDVVYTGPFYIPHTVRSLKLLDSYPDRPRVVILLLREEKFHAISVMKWVETDEVKHVGLCLVHGVRSFSYSSREHMNLGKRVSFIRRLGKLFKPKEDNTLEFDALCNDRRNSEFLDESSLF